MTSLKSEPYCKLPVIFVSQRDLKRKQVSQIVCKPMLKHQYFQCFLQLRQWPRTGFRLCQLPWKEWHCRKQVLHTQCESQTLHAGFFPNEALFCHLSSISPKNTQALFVILLFSLHNYVFSGLYPQTEKYNKGKVKDGLQLRRRFNDKHIGIFSFIFKFHLTSFITALC